MLYLFGNCQLDFLACALREHGQRVEHRPLASALTLDQELTVPATLARLQERHGVERFMHGRTLKNQFQLFTEDDPEATAVVLNLFHENEPLFVDTEAERIFFFDPAGWSEVPDVERWMRAHCQKVEPHPLRYLQRFTRLLEALSALRPRTPLLLLTRLFHYPAFGPQPRSYLRGWDELQHQWPQAMAEWKRRFKQLHILDMNRVFAGVWNREPAPGLQRIEAHCPFLRISLTPEDPDQGPPREMLVQRDVEHIGSIWTPLARKIADFMRHGAVRYTAREHIPEAWLQPWRPRPLPAEETLTAWLRSGSNYLAAQAVGELLLHPQPDHTSLLAQFADSMPVCHNLLHMIDKYSRIQKNPRIASWCEAHAQAVRAFGTQNGPTFTHQYLERLAAIARRATHTAHATV